MKNQKLIELRTKHGKTQQETAEKIGVSRPLYSLIESGRRKGSREFWTAVQELYGLTDAETWEMMKNEAADPQKVHNPAC